MSSVEKTSAADVSYPIFKDLFANLSSTNFFSEDISESDTRSKFIDPLFKDVLGWSEVDIRRESPSADGFSDYVLGATSNMLLVEAKRTIPRFNLCVSANTRKLRLAGPHLLANKEIAPSLKQAASYALDSGCPFALITNGFQYILFRVQVTGRSWKDGDALIWHSLDDIDGDFALFYSFFSKSSFYSGTVYEHFTRTTAVDLETFSPLEFIHNPDCEFVRNKFWNSISRVFSPILTDSPEYAVIQSNIVLHCYVSTPLSEEADDGLNRLLVDTLPGYLRDAGVVDLKVGAKGNTAFGHRLEEDIKEFKPKTYILTGGVGCGKTTFLRHYELVVAPKFINFYCVWLHVDYLSFGAVNSHTTPSDLEDYTYKRIRKILEDKYPGALPSDGEAIRDLFRAEIENLKITKLHNLAVDSETWNSEINSLVYSLFMSDKKYVEAVLKRQRSNSKRIVIVLDNTDQQGEQFQESVFLFSERLCREMSSLCIVSLREEKFFAAHRRGIFDAYGDRRFHIGSPDLSQVIRKRLEYGLGVFRNARPSAARVEEVDAIVSVLDAIIRSVTETNSNIIRMLACVSQGNIRHALDRFRQFISSGNTNVDKIYKAVHDEGFYIVPFHEFAKSSILGSRKYYKNEVSTIMNLFALSRDDSPSHLTSCRLLYRLQFSMEAPSSHGQGYISTGDLLREYREYFGHGSDCVYVIGELMSRGLVETEPPRLMNALETDALRISASGAYYWQYLARSFAYLDLVLFDTAIRNKRLARYFAEKSETTYMPIRIERVRAFIEYLADQEDGELSNSLSRDGIFATKLVAGISEQIEREIAYISERLGLA